ncbi:hypothetical protein [Thalassobellus suaedae]|uniref:Uncharacterized protein n=1 Tax=Thalassobellus suaedae TaxID=3074124 RepID=A0ABY9XVT3_9FLAO|nr:hypothetical protein RHP51_05005 [Flavobacteriaceae bacterium HL-DH14]
MPKISNEILYNKDLTLSRDDTWVGSDAQGNKKTKTYYLGAVAEYIALYFADDTQNNVLTEKPLGDINVTDNATTSLISQVNTLPNFDVLPTELVLFTGNFIFLDRSEKVQFVYALKTGKGNYGTNGTQINSSSVIYLNPQQHQTIANTEAIKRLGFNDKVYGGSTWVSGLTFNSYVDLFVLNGITKPLLVDGVRKSITETITLSDSDPVFARFDLIVINYDETITVVEGTPSASPAYPDIDEASQLLITPVLILAGATTPSGVVEEIIYNESAGEPNEWTFTDSSGGTISSVATGDAFDGTFHIEATGVGDFWRRFWLINDTPISVANLATFDFRLKKKPDSQTYTYQFYIRLYFLLDNQVVGNSLIVANNFFGFDNSNTSSYQNIIIPKEQIQFTESTFDRILFVVQSGEFKMDLVRLVYGLENPTNPDNHVKRTSEIINDGENGTSEYVEFSDLYGLLKT